MHAGESRNWDEQGEEIGRLYRAAEISLDWAIEHAHALLWELPGGFDVSLRVERDGFVATVEVLHGLRALKSMKDSQ